MGADQLPEILLAAFKPAERRLPCLTGLPLQQAQHPPTVVADLDAGADEACVALRQMLGLSRNVTRTRLIKIGELAVNKRRLTENLRGERLIQLSI